MPPGFDLCKATLSCKSRAGKRTGNENRQHTRRRGTLSLQVTPCSPACNAAPMRAGSSSPRSILPRNPSVAPKLLHPHTDHFQARLLTPRAAHSSRRPVPKWGTFSSLPQPHTLYISSPVQRAAPTLHKTNTKCSLRRRLHNQWWVLGAWGLGTAREGDRICKGTRFLAAGKHKPRGLATVWGCSSIPARPGPTYCSLVQRFVSGRWKSRQIRLFLNPSQQHRQCLGDCSHRPCVFKQGHILLLRMPSQTPFPVLQHLAGRLGWGQKGTQGSKTRGQHLEVHHCRCPNWHPGSIMPGAAQRLAPGESAKAERQQRDEGRDGERAEGATSALRTNGTTEGAPPSGEQDPRVQPRGGNAWQILSQSSLTQQQLPGTLISTN